MKPPKNQSELDDVMNLPDSPVGKRATPSKLEKPVLTNQEMVDDIKKR